MDAWKKSVFLGLTLLAFCVLVETMGFGKFNKMFPPKKHNHFIKSDTLPEGKDKNEAKNIKTATTVPKDCTETVTMTKEEISPKKPNSSFQVFTEYHLDDATSETTDLYSTVSLATTERAAPSGSNCPSGYTKQLNGSCYKFIDSSIGASRSEAQSECKGDFSHLVFIETKEENDFLVREAGSNTEYWIGIHERPNLFWDNGNQVTFANIDTDISYTFNDGPGCYVMSDYDERIWLDKQCSENFNYICEYEGGDCPSEYAITHSASCYKYSDLDSRATRSDAQLACKRDFSHLVFIETKEENDFLVREAGSNTEYWIGIHERPNLFWDNGNEVTFANIDPYNRYTFNDGTGCYRMNANGKRHWHDVYCIRQFHYICEHEGPKCPEEYTSNHRASCYKFAESKATLSEARSACMNDSSHLVFIETKEENDFLIRKAASSNEYWIGIHERPHLFWDNGNHVTFSNIDPGDMDTLSGRNGCYRMCNGTKRYWRDSSCSHNHGYICEYED